jgi:hypothetical protein
MSEITFRRTRRQLVVSLVAAGPLYGLLLALVYSPYVGLAYFALVEVLGVCAIPFGVTLTADGIVMRGFKRQLIPWQAIRYIDTYSLLGGHTVRLNLFDGKKKRLRAPVSGWGQKDPEFAAKKATIHQWWMYYTGQLMPPPFYPTSGQSGTSTIP